MNSRFVARPSKNFLPATNAREMAALFQRMDPEEFVELPDCDAIHLMIAVAIYPADSLACIDSADLHVRLTYLGRALNRGEQARVFTRDPYGPHDEELDCDAIIELTGRLRRLTGLALSTGEPVLLLMGFKPETTADGERGR
jgi:hypothetical protein